MRWVLMVALVTACGGAADDELPVCAERQATGCPLEGVTCDVCTAAEVNADGTKDVWVECSDGGRWGPGLDYDKLMDFVDYHCHPCERPGDTDCPADG